MWASFVSIGSAHNICGPDESTTEAPANYKTDAKRTESVPYNKIHCLILSNQSRMEETAVNSTGKKVMSPCDVEDLKKCLEENKGDYVKCQSQIEAFRSSCSIKKPGASPESSPKLDSGR
ncbi:hypothetical protein CDL15_Pgr022957 [Punica granatum]|uniref:Uncharacterized protein n=1 Tax=Punica granatum TaxID=22663 RepID=A0A218X2W8_PUNGR|nr:hypothetical protein CDL15_Pgr022957 [Punica granatum]PKI50731.1 hypothetical protein CRG98_028873 [Punica granatum]